MDFTSLKSGHSSTHIRFSGIKYPTQLDASVKHVSCTLSKIYVELHARGFSVQTEYVAFSTVIGVPLSGGHFGTQSALSLIKNPTQLSTLSKQVFEGASRT